MEGQPEEESAKAERDEEGEAATEALPHSSAKKGFLGPNV